jgi:membrane protease YdiL (CAAX protease family)
MSGSNRARSGDRRSNFASSLERGLATLAAMSWKKSWEPEAVLGLIGGVLASFVLGNVANGLLQGAGVSGFASDASAGSVLLATMSFHGAVIVLGTVFLKTHDSGWREVMGGTDWKRCLLLAMATLAVVSPIMFGLKFLSMLALDKLGWPVVDQTAVTMIMSAKPLTCAYLAFFAVVLAPVGEEFFFRGLLFPFVAQFRLPALVRSVRRSGHPKFAWFLRQQIWRIVAWFGVNAPTFLPLLVLALAMTWLYQKTGGLRAPILAHGLFNAANLVVLLLDEKYYAVKP